MRLIDADALGVGRCSKDVLPAAYCAGWNGLINLIDNAPTIDAVPVVRCRECKHRDEFTKMCQHPKAIGWDAIEPEDDDFCSYGERRADGQT